MNLREFRSNLQKIEKRLPSDISWPFLCDGSPLKCRIFVVGSYPARKIEEPFWGFWDDTHGFKRAKFIKKLEDLTGGLTRTRRYLEIVVDAAGPSDTLETNIYPYEKLKAMDSTAEHKRTDAFDYLLHTIRPQIILAYGSEAKKFFRNRSIAFEENRLNTINLDGLRIKLLPRQQLSYRTSHEKAREIGWTLARALDD